jgi:hypothetical protein
MLRLSACKDDIATPHSEIRVDRRGVRVIPLKGAWSGSAQVTEQQKCVQIPITVSAFSSQSKGKTPRFCPDVGHFCAFEGRKDGFLLLHWGVTPCRMVPDCQRRTRSQSCGSKPRFFNFFVEYLPFSAYLCENERKLI